MWTRAELKARAKVALAQNYWKLVLVGAIASIVGSGHNSSVEFNFSEETSGDILSSLGTMLPVIFGVASAGIIVAFLISFLFLIQLKLEQNAFS